MIADRVNRKWLIVGSLFVWSAVTYGLGYAQTFQQVYWLRALMGVSEALYLPTGLAMIADLHLKNPLTGYRHPHVGSLYRPGVGRVRSDHCRQLLWLTVFHWFGIAGIIYAVVLIFLLHDKEGHASKERAVSRRGQLAAPSGQPSIFRSFGVILGTLSFWIMLFYFMAPSFPGWATKNWLPTLFSGNLGIEMAKQVYGHHLHTIASFIGVLIGGPLSDRWVQKNIRGRIYTSTIGLALTIPSLVLLGFGDSHMELVGAAVLFGIGFGMFDTNNMPILCQIIPQQYRATAYGIMNMMGVFAGYAVTLILGSPPCGNLGADFSKLAIVVLAALLLIPFF